MKVKDINLKQIEKLLGGVPDEMDIQSIEFIGNDVRLNISASYKILQKEAAQKSAQELFKQIKILDTKSKIDNN